jgi:hypothetical protein
MVEKLFHVTVLLKSVCVSNKLYLILGMLHRISLLHTHTQGMVEIHVELMSPN